MLPRLVVFVLCLTIVGAQFSIPPIEFQALEPKGLRVAITDIPGIKLFAFHGKVNENLNSNVNWHLKGDVTQPRNGRWIFEDNDIELRPGDIINYWVFVQHNIFGYRKDNQKFEVTQLVSSDTPWTIPSGEVFSSGPAPTQQKPNCPTSKTTINDGKSVCRGQLIFEDDFTSQRIDPAKWIIEQRIPCDQQENEFVFYQKDTVKIVSERIRIEPKLLTLQAGFSNERVKSGILDLTQGCTAQTERECKLQAVGPNILPPLITGKVSTRNLFSFKYGKIEIKAKLPQGEWLYPVMYLEPLRFKYGSDGYDSGIIRVGFARGNLQLEADGEKLDNTVLSGGPVLSQFEPCRQKTIMKSPSSVPWGNSFHTYGLVWDENSITLQVDGKPYGSVSPPPGGFSSLSAECPKLNSSSLRWKIGTAMAPFDEEFYISLGLAAGGISDFPDSISAKPWKNKSSKNKVSFLDSFADWYNTWPEEDKYLLIDSVKVWAL